VLIKGKTLTTDDEGDQILAEEEEVIKSGAVKADSAALDSSGKRNKSEKTKFTKELSDLTILKAYRLASFDAKYTQPTSMCTSFNEAAIARLIAKNHSELTELNKWVLSRTYPKASRVDSSNYNPVPCWNAGIQLVALNFQTPSSYMWAHYARFVANGNSGYVLKPPSLRLQGPDENTVKCLEVKVLSACQLPKYNYNHKGPTICPLVQLSAYGIDEDTREYKTNFAKNNGFNPIWNETFEFTFKSSSVALLVLSVEDEGYTVSANIGHWGAPVECIRPGFRALPLYDKVRKEITGASLFCMFTFKDAPSVKLQGSKKFSAQLFE